MEGIHIKLYLDNKVAIKYLNKIGDMKSLLNKLTRDICGWCLKRRLWISVFHIPGKDNYVADRLSRKMNENMEWSLSQEVFLDVQANLGALDIDLFASRDNHKLDRYVSYLPDSKAVAVNAFSLTWTNNSFLFPPFSLLGLVLQKIQQDRATVVLVAPVFHTQPWFPTLLRMICHQPFLLPKPESCLSLPKDNQKRHPLTKMRLGCFKISGTPSLVREYQKTLPTLSSHHGGSPPKTILVVNTKTDVFCDREKANKFDPSIKEVLKFLSELFSVKIGYSGINTAKSAISSLVSVISNKDIGSQVLVKRFMKGIFK